jgi:hypothetical protein
MRKTTTFLMGLFVLALAASARAADLTVIASAQADGDLYDFDYLYQVTGTAAIDNLYLGSDDLSPVSDILFKKNGVLTTDWSWLGNDTPKNYLQFFSTTDSLSDRDTLEVMFSSPGALFVPTPGHVAGGYDSASGQSYTVAGTVVGPSAVPEPGVLSLLMGATVAGCGLRRRRRPRGA